MKRIWFTTLLICSMVVFTYHHSLADGEFSNSAQASHAANLSDAAGAALDGNVENAETNLGTAEDTKDDAQIDLEKTEAAAKADLETAESDLATAKADLATAKADLATAKADDIAGAKADLETATAALETAEADLATAKVDAKADLETAEAALETAEADLADAKANLDQAVGELAGVSVDSIADLRSSGMGWGEIAHALGVHPGVLGLGHMKHFTVDIATNLPAPEIEIAEATKRDVKHGWAKGGHGMSTSVASSSKKGLGLAETDLGVGRKGSKASKGNSGSKSSSATSSKGNSKNDRGSSGGPSSDRGNSGNSSSGKSKSDRGKSGGPSNDKDNNGNSGNDKGNSGNNGNKGGKSK